MSLKKQLRDQNYDLIDGPIRNHKPLQLWLKKPLNGIEIYQEHVTHAFTSPVELQLEEDDALEVNASKKDEYSFNIGITVLESVLKSLGLGDLELSAKIKSGKEVTISYDNAITRACGRGKLEEYFSIADFKHSNIPLLKNLNANDVILISGIMLAKNLVVEISTTLSTDANLIASLNDIAEGKISFTNNNAGKIKMVSGGTGYFPIAVQAHRLQFHKGTFVAMKSVGDNWDWF